MEDYIWQIATVFIKVLIPFVTVKFVLNYLRQFLFND